MEQNNFFFLTDCTSKGVTRLFKSFVRRNIQGSGDGDLPENIATGIQLQGSCPWTSLNEAWGV